MYDPFYDYFGLSDLVSRMDLGGNQQHRFNQDCERHLRFVNDFHTNGVSVPIENQPPNDINNNNLISTTTGFLPLPIKLSDITEFSKVMQNRGRSRNNSGRSGGSGVGGSLGRPPVVSWCVFCKNNGESELVYASHKLKSEDGMRTTCPILRAYTCPLCGTNGDGAHTIKYCPLNEADAASTGPGTIGSQYRTPRTSTGRRRTSSLSGGTGSYVA